MNAFFWILKIALFLLALTFAVKNTDLVTVRYYLGAQWQGPLILVILVVFCLGAAAGVMASLAHIVRLRGEIRRLRAQARPEAGAADTPPRAAASGAPSHPANIPDAV
jgi:lipopolysaccharide assembly protein A